ncbi:MAG: hypothetical protein RIQ71_2051, partial [Verrucomicrobiota bacterium]
MAPAEITSQNLILEKGLSAPLQTAENAENFQEALALANGIPPEEAMEWMAGVFALIPLANPRLVLPVAAEATFRSLAFEDAASEELPWVPVGKLGPLLILGHFNPAASGTWRIPEQFVVRTLLTQPAYTALREDLKTRLETRPLALKEPRKPTQSLATGSSPETALKWLLSEYPFREEERVQL